MPAPFAPLLTLSLSLSCIHSRTLLFFLAGLWSMIQPFDHPFIVVSLLILILIAHSSLLANTWSNSISAPLANVDHNISTSTRHGSRHAILNLHSQLPTCQFPNLNLNPRTPNSKFLIHGFRISILKIFSQFRIFAPRSILQHKNTDQSSILFSCRVIQRAIRFQQSLLTLPISIPL